MSEQLERLQEGRDGPLRLDVQPVPASPGHREVYGATYIQHNPQAADGPEAFINFVHWLRAENPDLTLDIKRAIAEDDMVATHARLTLKPGEPGLALADFFRLEDGKVVEHWDVIQPVAEDSANANGMF